MTDEEIKKAIEKELDKTEAIWDQVGDQFVFENKYSLLEKGGEILPTKLPGFPFIEDGKPEVADFIALVLDIRDSTKHLIQAISAKTSKVSQLQRVLYETAAVNTAGLLIIQEKKGGITEFLGDGFLAFFKVKDEKNPGEVYSAHNAAKKCIRIVTQVVNELLYKRYKLPPLEIGIGMAYSKAIVTIIGSESNYHPKAIGECVYRSSKLSFGRNEIYIDERLEKLWPTEDGGKLTFTQIDQSKLPENRKIEFNGFKLTSKS